MLVKEYFWESFLAVQAAITFTHHLADCHILLFIFSSILSHVWNNCWLQFEEHACAALSAQPWRCHPLHTKLSIVYSLAFFCCNENNYGWKHFANDEVVRASIWNIWFQLCQEVTFNLGFKPATGELKEQSGRWAVVVHETRSSCRVCAKQGVQSSQFWHLGADPRAQGVSGSPERALQTRQTRYSVLYVEPAMLQRTKKGQVSSPWVFPVPCNDPTALLRLSGLWRGEEAVCEAAPKSSHAAGGKHREFWC